MSKYLFDRHGVVIVSGFKVRHVLHSSHKTVTETNGGVLMLGSEQVAAYNPEMLEVIEMERNPQRGLMLYHPLTGIPKPYPSSVDDFRKYYSTNTWLYNPYSGTKRNSLDIESDPLGYGIVQDGLPLLAEKS